MRNSLAAMLAAIVASCASSQPLLRTAEPSPVIARYGSRLLRQAEVDAAAGADLTALEAKMYELRVETAERLALEQLVAEAARKEGRSAEAWLEARLSREAFEPSEADLRALFEHARAQQHTSASYEEVLPQLRRALEQQEKARRARRLFADLKREAGYVLVARRPAAQRVHVEALGPARGPADAPVTIVEFADFECPYCGRVAQVLEGLLAAYPRQVRLVFRHFPLSFHPSAAKAAEAAACADEQGKFWVFHDELFGGAALEPDALKALAARLGLESERFEQCLDSGQMAAAVQRDVAAGQRFGVSGTPAFFINGVLLSGAQPREAFERLIDDELRQAVAPDL